MNGWKRDYIMRDKAPLSESGSNEILLTESCYKNYREIFYIQQRFFTSTV